jgi:hypothetical protein
VGVVVISPPILYTEIVATSYPWRFRHCANLVSVLLLIENDNFSEGYTGITAISGSVMLLGRHIYNDKDDSMTDYLTTIGIPFDDSTGVEDLILLAAQTSPLIGTELCGYVPWLVRQLLGRFSKTVGSINQPFSHLPAT